MLTAASLRPAIAAAFAAVGLVALTGCSTSFEYATDKPNVIANGGYGTTSDGNLRINGAAIVADRPADATKPASTGVLIATISLAPQVNPATASEATIKGLAITGIALDTTNKDAQPQDAVAAAGAVSVEVEAGDAENPAGTKNLGNPAIGGIALTGSFTPGEILPILITLKNGATLKLEVPVVKPCGYYAAVHAAGTPTKAPAPEQTEAASVGIYDCAYAETQDHQGAGEEATTHAETSAITPNEGGASIASSPAATPTH